MLSLLDSFDGGLVSHSKTLLSCVELILLLILIFLSYKELLGGLF